MNLVVLFFVSVVPLRLFILAVVIDLIIPIIFGEHLMELVKVLAVTAAALCISAGVAVFCTNITLGIFLSLFFVSGVSLIVALNAGEERSERTITTSEGSTMLGGIDLPPLSFSPALF